MCLSYDTTFEMGDFYVSVLTYRQNEFKETPVIPLMFIFHMERIEYVHSFFFSRVAELFPEIAESKRIIIVTDDEKAITNAVFKTWPRISLFRCWIHAWKNIKSNYENAIFETRFRFLTTRVILSNFYSKDPKNLTSRCLLDFIYMDGTR